MNCLCCWSQLRSPCGSPPETPLCGRWSWPPCRSGPSSSESHPADSQCPWGWVTCQSPLPSDKHWVWLFLNFFNEIPSLYQRYEKGDQVWLCSCCTEIWTLDWLVTFVLVHQKGTLIWNYNSNVLSSIEVLRHTPLSVFECQHSGTKCSVGSSHPSHVPNVYIFYDFQSTNRNKMTILFSLFQCPVSERVPYVNTNHST